MIKENILRPLLNLARTIVNMLNFNIVKIYFNPSELDKFLKRIHPVKTQYELIRIGPDVDSGYLVPDDLKGISACISPGVDYKSSFEKQLFDDYNIQSFLCDYSVDGPPLNSKGFHFTKKYLNSYEDEINMTLESWLDKVKIPGDYILQMDIEGGEYDVITVTDKDLFKKFRIIIIEFHHLDLLVSSIGFRAISSVFDKLLVNFRIVHIHPNNVADPVKYKSYTFPPAMEFTFLRKDRITKFEYTELFPHPLDCDNVGNRKPVILPKIFYSNKS